MSLSVHFYPSRTKQLCTLTVGHDRLIPENDGWAHCLRDHCRRLPLPYQDADGLPLVFERHTDEGLEVCVEDAHGSPLTYATAGDIVKCPRFNDDGRGLDLHPFSRAALAYLEALPPDIPVILYFC